MNDIFRFPRKLSNQNVDDVKLTNIKIDKGKVQVRQILGLTNNIGNINQAPPRKIRN